MNRPFVIASIACSLGLAYVPGILDSATAGRWAMLAVIVPIALSYSVRPKGDAAYVLGSAFVAWCMITTVWAANIYDAMDAAFKLLLLSALFHLGAQMQSLRPVYLGLGVALAINAVIAVAQLFGFGLIDQDSNPPAGLFGIKNQMAEVAALVLIGLVGERVWWLAVAVMPAVILPMSRGVFVALAVAGAERIWRLRSGLDWWIVLVGSAAALTLTLTVVDTSHTITQRLDLWRDTIAAFTVFGHGIGSFYVSLPDFAQYTDLARSYPQHAHNDLIELAFETGIIGLTLALALVGGLIRWAGEAERAILLVFFVIGLFAFPFHLPVGAALVALVAGHVCRKRDYLCDALDAGAVSLRASEPHPALAGYPYSSHPRGTGIPA